MKAVRVRTRCGEVRICELPAGCDLPAWWMEMRAAGHVVGHRWAMPFDNIALADVVELPDQASQPNLPAEADVRRPSMADHISRLIQSGTFRPPE